MGHPRPLVRVATTLVFCAALTMPGPGPLSSPPAAASSASTGAQEDRPWTDRSLSPEERAGLLLEAMTLDEKIGMLHGTIGAPVPTTGYIAPIRRLGVPGVTMTDGPAGVRNGQKATEMPAPVAQAASFDTDTARQYGRAVGREARARGQSQVFGPGTNIQRVPVGGRNFEYYSEDPYLAGTMAGADTTGIQSEGVIATVKHFAANNQETDRMTVSADIDERTLHEIYGTPFDLAVRQGRPGSVMCSYNRVNTVYACSNARTLRTMLRSRFGFDGYVVSDYPSTHATSDLAAGLNVELPLSFWVNPLSVRAALHSGDLTRQDIDQRVREVLTVLFRFGLFERNGTATSPLDEAAGNAAAQHSAEQGAVLLKNDDDALPLTGSADDIAVIGSAASGSAQGGGSSKVDALSKDTALDAVKRRAGGSAHVTYHDGSFAGAAADAAKSADVALVFAHDKEEEGSDRSSLSLPDGQDELISKVAAANPETIVVLQTGAPVLMPWLPKVKSVLETWYPGARGGAATSRLLWGDVNPSGKLPQTFPAREDEVPASTEAQYPGVNGTAHYSEGVDVGYRWYDKTHTKPLFPFGHGLSYSTFRYSDLRLEHGSGGPDDSVGLSFTVTNTGKRAGSEAAQVYVAKPDTGADSPPRELGGYRKVHLAAGESKHVRVSVDPRQLSYWDTGAHEFRVRQGEYGIAVGSSSRELPLSASYLVRAD
ncbi:glycosyl hydrolase [Streptomyces sp. HNM0575]|uniref:beta-glucosidase family protein n=1 Tax=Streptomyces sp. HNM0575 TaxID=2716338 RepID=UPI00145E8C0D|nr:glycoside hydrolase family 3 C-terminal domain-containing protein [Streptomyces sp. HNM0575]NLU73162.1 glycosyl hydrolase [Streptomyces sp. HNM0575]